MNFLPVAHLEMRSAARKPMTYYARCLTGFVTITSGLGFVFAGFNRAMSTASAGQAVFYLLTASGYALLATQGILLTSDCISQEKREGTLGLLFLTDLNGFDIVAGKMTAQVSRSAYCLLAAFPAFGFCIILGGVGWGDFVYAALGLLNTLFFFASLGMFISACVWRERVAAAWGGAALLLLGLLLPGCCIFFNWPRLAEIVPIGALIAAVDPLTGMNPLPGTTGSLLTPHLLGWIFLGAASFLAPRTWTPGAKGLRSPGAARRRKNVAGQSALPWVTEPAKSFLGTASLILISGLVLAALPLSTMGLTMPEMAGMILLLHSILKFQAATQAGRMLAGRRRSGELELLLTTPCDEDEIVRHCLLALKRSLLLPVLLTLGVDLALLAFGWWRTGVADGFGWAAGVSLEVVWLFVNLYSLTWVALFLGLRLANPVKAAGRAIFYVMVLPWLLLIFFGALAALVVRGHQIGAEMRAPIVAIFVIAFFFCNTFFTGWAMNELRDQFRAVAAER